MSKLALTALSLTLVLSVGSLAETHAQAQDKSAPVCMTSTAKEAKAGQKFTIFVASNRVSKMMTKGFVEEPCSGKDAGIAQYRAEMCTLSEQAPPSVKNEIAKAYRVNPDELCKMAKELT